MDLKASSLSTIEEDGESVRSGSAILNPLESADTMLATAERTGSFGVDGEVIRSGKDKEKKKRRKSRRKDADAASSFLSFAAVEHDTAQQILVDLCTEMKELKTFMQKSQEKAIANLDSNQQIVTTLVAQMDMLQQNMKQLDFVIESKATPEQIEELARIRAVQEMMQVVTDDKERTVGVYEDHVRRSYEEIERLRQDLVNERQEVAALRAEIESVREHRPRMVANGLGLGNMFRNDAADSTDGESDVGSRPGSMYMTGGVKRLASRGGDVATEGEFDDMTLESKGSLDTTSYEVKSLKKRIIHMKKKLAAVQLEARETGELRAEVERLRVQCETEKKAAHIKNEKISTLEHELAELKRNPPKAASSSASVTQSKPSVHDTMHTKKKWWAI
jgi:hypothetical protein